MYYGMYFKFELYKIVLFSLNYFKHLCLKNLTILLTVSSNNGLMQYLQSDQIFCKILPNFYIF